jgi:DNA modification methylase
MKKEGSLAINFIHQGDCIALLKQIPDNSVDLIFADPPYNLQLKSDLLRSDNSKVETVNDAWDKFENMNSYDDFTETWLSECKRVLKDTGCIWVIGTYHNIFRVGTKLQDLGFWILNDVVWIKTNPMPNFKGTRFNNAHETMIWATKSEKSKFTFHYQSMKVMNEDLQMRSDWFIPICKGDERIKINGQKAHSTQKPEELLYRVILSTSNVGDIVLDPFSGSGTTAAVAKRLGRNFIAFEREQFYVDVANERLDNVIPLDLNLLEYKVEVKKPRIPFVNLIDKSFIQVGEYIYSKNEKHKAKINADTTIECDGIIGSIHIVSAKLTHKDSCNGWKFWYVKRNGELIVLDELREKFFNQYLK